MVCIVKDFLRQFRGIGRQQVFYKAAAEASQILLAVLMALRHPFLFIKPGLTALLHLPERIHQLFFFNRFQ